MKNHTESVTTWRRQFHGTLVIVKKNAMLYYLRPPVLIFGVLFPVFFFLAFKMGRPIPPDQIVPGMVAMALWFTASSVGPLVTPWERRARTYERTYCYSSFFACHDRRGRCQRPHLWRISLDSPGSVWREPDRRIGRKHRLASCRHPSWLFEFRHAGCVAGCAAGKQSIQHHAALESCAPATALCERYFCADCADARLGKMDCSSIAVVIRRRPYPRRVRTGELFPSLHEYLAARGLHTRAFLGCVSIPCPVAGQRIVTSRAEYSTPYLRIGIKRYPALILRYAG